MIAVLLCVSGFSQTTLSSNIQIDALDVDSVYYLGDWVIANSITVQVEDEILDESQWQFHSLSGTWRLLDDSENTRFQNLRVLISFESYPISIPRTIRLYSPTIIDKDELLQNSDSVFNEILISENSAQSLSNIEQRGSLSRGVVVGTNQDFALESGLQFELSGQLTDDIAINAVLTDRSIPIQPDGTTQNIREFDRVYIQLESERTSIEMGDVDASFNGSLFAKLNRRLQGVAGVTKGNNAAYKAAFSVVRGTFISKSFEGNDGVQGPYRLTGRDGEEFIIILAGTENVYINGQLAKRGEEFDYIIDYGLGEVYFTNNVLIKDETRIVIEYEYVDRNFTRTLIAAEGKQELLDGKLQIGASVIRQADGDELLSQEVLTNEDIDVLKNVGDNLDAAIVSGVDQNNDDESINVRYAAIDTTVNGIETTIYRNIPGSPESNLVVRFTNVGIGQGSYQRISGEVNGLLYEWVGPGNGEYEPFRKLPAPEEHQIVALNTTYDVSDKVSVFGEWAVSNYDRNRFSTLNDGENSDFSYLSGFAINDLNIGSSLVEITGSRRYSGKNFKFFERTRDVEFERKWNIGEFNESQESTNEIALEIQSFSSTQVKAELGNIQLQDFESIRQGFHLASNESNFLSLNYTQDWVSTKDQRFNEDGNWLRQRGMAEKKVGRFTPSILFEQEQRIQRSISSDSLTSTSFSFYEVGPGINYVFKKVELAASIVLREEFRVLDNSLEKEARSLEQRYTANLISTTFDSRNNVSLRRKEITSEFESLGSTRRRGLLIRSVTNYSLPEKEWDGRLLYEANTERRALFQEAYIEVGPELGQYIWIDENEDGIEQIDEFFPELSPNEGTYVLQFLPSDELFPVIDLNARLSNEFKPLRFLPNTNSVFNFLSNVKISSRFQVQENTTAKEYKDVYFLKLSTFRNDSTTIQGRLFIEKELELFPTSDKFEINIGGSHNRSLNRRTTESIEQYGQLLYLNSRLQINRKNRLLLDIQSSENRSVSNQLTSRDFDIKAWSIIPSIQSRFSQSLESNFSFSYSYKLDRIPLDPTKVRILKIINSNRMFLLKKVRTNSRLELRRSSVEGISSALGTFELTEGTGEGTNLLWALDANYQLSNMVRLSFNYDGRTVRNRSNIHTIKLVVRAIF